MKDGGAAVRRGGGHLFQRHICSDPHGSESLGPVSNWWYFSAREELMGLWRFAFVSCLLQLHKGGTLHQRSNNRAYQNLFMIPQQAYKALHGSGVRYGEHRGIAGLRTIIPLGHSPIYCIVYYS